MNLLKKSISQALSHPWLGIPTSLAARAVGAERIGRRISCLCKHAPAKVRVEIPARIGGAGRGFVMHGEDDWIVRAIWWWGWDGNDKPMPDLFASLSREARCILDVGACAGFYALTAAACNPRAEVHAFEPFPPPRARLERNAAASGLDGRIRVAACAVSDQPGEADFYVPTPNGVALETSSSLNSSHRPNHGERLRVRVTTLDEYAETHGLPPVDLIKIDVETYEDHVLRGGARVIRESRPIIFLEILPTADADALMAVRDEFDYVSGRLHPEGIRWQDRIQAGDRFLNHVFCPAEKKARVEAAAAALGYGSIPAGTS